MNETAKYEFTIVVPIYNEQDNLSRVEEQLSRFLPTSCMKACVLLVNDGSSDDSLKLMKEICQRQPDFFYISSNENHGLSTAMKAGIDTVESKYMGYIDADLQTNPEDFNLLLEYAPEYELVTGIRAKRKDSVFKKLQSKIANGFRRAMTGDTATDTGCPLKVMRTDIAKRIPFFNGMHRFPRSSLWSMHASRNCLCVIIRVSPVCRSIICGTASQDRSTTASATDG